LRRSIGCGRGITFVTIAPALAVLLLMLGCDRGPVTTADNAAPATAPVILPASAPATQPRASHMLINGQRVEFPPAKLVVKTRGEAAHALLYSDDPPNAIDEKYTGNSFYLEMRFELTDAAPLSTVRWEFKAPDSDRAETVSGIYLDGRKRHLQPFDVVVEFEDGPPTKALVRGQFLMFDADADAGTPGQLIPVVAELQPELTMKSR
jgi:hypothetical protein